MHARRAHRVRAVHGAGARGRAASTCATCSRSRSTRRRRRTSTTRSPCRRRTAATARGCTSRTSRRSSPAGTPLDRGASERAFTTYVPGRAAPMLPPQLADDRCSLRPHEDRLCVTVELPPSGEPRFYRSVIRSDARLTYAQAERREAEPGRRRGARANRPAHRRDPRAPLRARRARIESPEIAFEFDGHGSVARAWKESEPTAHRLVEELMIAANEAVAQPALLTAPRGALPRARAAGSAGDRAAAEEARRPGRADAAGARSS